MDTQCFSILSQSYQSIIFDSVGEKFISYDFFINQYDWNQMLKYACHSPFLYIFQTLLDKI